VPIWYLDLMSAQMQDKLEYEGKKYSIKETTLSDLIKGDFRNSSPLEQYLVNKDFKKYFTSEYVEIHTANWRGYLCDWEIDKQGSLWLKAFHSRSKVLRNVNQLLGVLPIGSQPTICRDIDLLKAEVMQPYMHASWFSGVIYAREFLDYEGAINGLRIEIENGFVTDSIPCHVGSHYGRPLKNYIED